MLPGVRELSHPGFARILRLELGSTVAFLAIHATRGGRSFGGVRIQEYPSEQSALDDALALSRAMSRKMFLADLPGGGAKTVVMRPPDAQRGEVLTRLGDVIAKLDGAYHCGGDLGYTAADAQALRARTEHVAPDAIGHYTAATVFEALRSTCQPHVVAVQGLGDVGRPLAERLRSAGVRVIATDLHPVEGFELIDPGLILEQEVDVFAPCAGGGVLSPSAVDRLRCRVVCGGANNPLTDHDVARLLAERGIVYVPDFVANVGAVAHGVCRASGVESQTSEHILAVGSRTRELIELATARDGNVLTVAIAEADRAITRFAD